MKNKINLLVVFGGKSSEHSISILSANNVLKSLDKDKYNTSLIYIDKKGEWYKMPSDFDIDESKIKKSLKSFALTYLILEKEKGCLFELKSKKTTSIDVCFPVLHGLNGEDGAIQGLLKMYNIKCVGSSILGSSINMDKVIQKKILQCSGIKIAKFVCFKKEDILNWTFEKISKILKNPFFVKPANTGSSIGISKVSTKEEYLKAVALAIKHDNKIIIEESIQGREIECSIIGNGEIFVSLPGEIIPQDEFYSYEAKYSKNSQTKLILPAKLNTKTSKSIQREAVLAFKALECKGFARVDMFLTANNEIYINEINTIPGFTNISMFPKLLELSGLSYTQLINLIIQLALKA